MGHHSDIYLFSYHMLMIDSNRVMPSVQGFVFVNYNIKWIMTRRDSLAGTLLLLFCIQTTHQI